MVKLSRRNNEEKSLEEKAAEVEEQINEPLPERSKPIDLTKTVSTGSTLLDLIISGRRRHGGGIPGGIIMEISGESGSAKTAILSEIAAYTQARGGEVKYLDPEGRLDLEYSETYGMHLDKTAYYRPKTVKELFETHIKQWKPKRQDVINMIASDSLTALCSELDMEEGGDKRGQQRAKLFSEGCRKVAVDIADNNWLIACSNQLRDGEYGKTVPGGNAIPFYSSLRIRTSIAKKIEKSVVLSNKDPENKEDKRKDVTVKEVIGLEISCRIIKSSIDRPFRECSIFLLYNWGIDNIRGCLQYLKDMKGDTKYNCCDGTTYVSIDNAINYIEENNLYGKLKENTIALWNEIEEKFEIKRPAKIRI